MKTISDFGIVTACHAGDYFMAKATCASVRHFMPDVPICVIVDGDFSIKELEDTYAAIPLPLRELEDHRLRKICPGSSKSKWAAMWEAPFERYVFMDADVLALGDLCQDPLLKERDFVIMSPFIGDEASSSNINHFFYDLERLRSLFPDFEWKGMPFFCAGAFATKRGLFPIEKFLELESLSAKEPSLFRFSDQGTLNFLVQDAMRRGTLEPGINRMQYIVPDYPIQESVNRFGADCFRIPGAADEPLLLHFCGNKPLIQNLHAYRAPFTAFRWRHQRNVHGKGVQGNWAALRGLFGEEWKALKPRLRRKLSGKSETKNAWQGSITEDRRNFSVAKRAKWIPRNESGNIDGKLDVVSKFGVVTACHKDDCFMARTTCASIRHFMPDVPICVIVDGDVSIKELEDRYGVMAMRVSDCRSDKLREMCSRSTRSKLVAQWEGPFERYLWVDCDTIVMGDFVHAEAWAEADFWAMTTIKPGTVSDKNLRHFFLDPDELRQLDPKFDAHKFPLFCDGVYVARRGCLDLDRTYEMWQKSKEHTNLFSWTKCQGLTNYMVFSSQQRGELTVRVCDRQYIVPDHPRSEAGKRFGTHAKLPPHRWDHAEVVHFCGIKPFVQNTAGYSSLYTAFRLKDCREGREGVRGSIGAAARVGAAEVGMGLRRLRKRLGI